MIFIPNALAEFYDDICKAGELCRRESTGMADGSFMPSFDLPPLDDRLQKFFAASSVQVLDLGTHGGSPIRLLDLTGNTRTRTTKTFASHVMVARAVAHIQTTGESVMLVTPTSANKGGALRDAVLRAIECGLVEPRQLRIAIVVPQQGLSKLWSSPLASDAELRALNPVFHAQAQDGAIVKTLTREFVHQNADMLLREHGLRLWHTYHLDNYRMADAIRAFVEADRIGPPADSRPRVHAQAVSSAFGLLGHHHGQRVLRELKGRVDVTPAQWLLVQHLGTPDLVLNQHFGSFSREHLPRYAVDPASGLLVQSELPFFPAHTFALDEVIDSTFYSHRPATAPLIKAIQHEQGGAGIVVSLRECLDRYAMLRSMLPSSGPALPADPRELREWALAMVLAGVLGAIDRNLVPHGSEVLVHTTGSYSTSDYVPFARHYAVPVSTVDDMRQAIVVQ